MRRPLLVLALSWIIGILLSTLFSIFPMLPLLGASGILYLFGLAHLGNGWGRNGYLGLLVLGMMGAGFFRAELLEGDVIGKADLVRAVQFPRPVHLRGTVESAFVRKSSGNWSALVSDPDIWDGSQWLRLPGYVEVYSRSLKQPAGEAGQHLEVAGKWRAAGKTAIPGGFDLQRPGPLGLLMAQEGRWVCTEPPSLSTLQRLVRWRDGWRGRIRDWMLTHLPERAGALALAITTGDRGYLDGQLQSDLHETGLLHLTAVSGLNVTIVILTLPWVLKPLGIQRRWRALAGIPLAFCLLALVGAQASVLRAAFAGMALMLARFIDRPTDPFNLLAGAALAILMVFPFQIFQPGFLLSFTTVAVILLWGPVLETNWLGYRLQMVLHNRFSPRMLFLFPVPRIFLWMVQAVWISALASLAAAPISAWFFHSVAWGGILGNLAAVPLAEGITVLGVLAAFGLAFAPWLENWIAWPLGVISQLLLGWIDWAAQWQFGFQHILAPDPVLISLAAGVLLILGLPATWFAGGFRSRRVLTLGLLAVLSWWPGLPSREGLRLHFIDVGQGDACLIQFPRGETLLIDTGPPLRQGPSQPGRLAEGLMDLGLKSLDAVVITHPELDHAGGLPDLLREYRVGRILCSGDVNTSQPFRNLAEMLRRQAIQPERVLSGDCLSGFENASVSVLSPYREELLCQIGGRNERSVVLLVECQGLRVLLTGDISEEVESNLVEEGCELNCDILKVAHHGSSYSSSDPFLRAASPDIAVISCGENSFGHPSPPALKRLEVSGVEVLTTQEKGTVHVHWKDGALRIHTRR